MEQAAIPKEQLRSNYTSSSCLNNHLNWCFCLQTLDALSIRTIAATYDLRSLIAVRPKFYKNFTVQTHISIQTRKNLQITSSTSKTYFGLYNQSFEIGAKRVIVKPPGKQFQILKFSFFCRTVQFIRALPFFWNRNGHSSTHYLPLHDSYMDWWRTCRMHLNSIKSLTLNTFSHWHTSNLYSLHQYWVFFRSTTCLAHVFKTTNIFKT